jgi:hypothetical protein
LCHYKLKNKITSLLKEYALKDLKQHTANLCAAVTVGLGPNRLAYSCRPSLEALAEPPPPKRVQSENPHPFKLHDVRLSFYEGKN